MPLEAPAVGEIALLEYLVNQATPTNLVLHLYANDVTINPATVYDSLTEVSGSLGYTPISMPGSGWTITSPANLGTATYSQVTFSFTTAASVYGYYVTSTTSSQLLFLERFSGAPFTIPSSGGTVTITPTITLL